MDIDNVRELMNQRNIGGGMNPIMRAQMSANQNNNDNNSILFVDCNSIDLRLSYCISDFLIMHFQPKQIICVDTLDRGKYVQNHSQLSNQLPLLRKLHNTHFIDYITFMENLINKSEITTQIKTELKTSN